MPRHDFGVLEDAGTPQLARDHPLDAGRADLACLVGRYVDDLREQAAVLLELPGHLEIENHAEAGAYLTVAEDLTRLLTGELQLTARD